MKHCKNCGAELAEEGIICPVCGFCPEEEAPEETPVEETSAEEAAANEDLADEAVGEETPAETPADEDAEEAEPADETEAAGNEESEPVSDDESDSGETIEAGSFADAEEGSDETEEADSAEDAEVSEDSEVSEDAEEPRKNRWSGLATLIVIITVLVLLGLVALVLYKEGTLQKWWDDIRPKTKSACTMGDYSEIQVLRSAVEVSDETVDSYVLSLVGGELTDESAAAYAATDKNCDATTAAELTEYAHDYIYKYYLYNEIIDYLKGITTVTSYDEVREEELIAYATEDLEYTASSYGMDVDTVATYYGYESALDYATDTAHEYQEIIMIIDKVLKDKGLTYTEEDVRAAIDDFMEENGYSMYYASTDEFLEMAGDTWKYLFENLTYKYEMAMEALESNVVLIDEPAE